MFLVFYKEMKPPEYASENRLEKVVWTKQVSNDFIITFIQL